MGGWWWSRERGPSPQRPSHHQRHRTRWRSEARWRITQENSCYSSRRLSWTICCMWRPGLKIYRPHTMEWADNTWLVQAGLQGKWYASPKLGWGGGLLSYSVGEVWMRPNFNTQKKPKGPELSLKKSFLFTWKKRLIKFVNETGALVWYKLENSDVSRLFINPKRSPAIIFPPKVHLKISTPPPKGQHRPLQTPKTPSHLLNTYIPG